MERRGFLKTLIGGLIAAPLAKEVLPAVEPLVAELPVESLAAPPTGLSYRLMDRRVCFMSPGQLKAYEALGYPTRTTAALTPETVDKARGEILGRWAGRLNRMDTGG